MIENSKTPKQLCAAHSFSLATFFRLVAAGKIEARKIGRKTIITAEAEKLWLASLPRAGGAVRYKQSELLSFIEAGAVSSTSAHSVRCAAA